MPALPAELLTMPIAHRGLHGPGVPENSLAAFRAAIEAGYAIECDIQRCVDGVPVVFHDYDLSRMAGDESFVADLTAEDLSAFRLLKTNEAIPTLAEMLRLVAGQVPLLIEIKDQDGRLGGNIGDLQQRVAALLKTYDGPVAVMSFNPEAVAAFHAEAPEIAVGLTTCAYDGEEWPMLDAQERARLGAISDYGRVGAVFISHDHVDLGNPAVAELKAAGVPVLCWTIRNEAEEAQARKLADNITFENYLAAK